jgi:FAD/FMN-containing dehydrogenase
MGDALSIQNELKNLLGDSNVISDGGAMAEYFRLATEADGLIAAKPGNVEDVQEIVRLARQQKVPVLTINDGSLSAAYAKTQGIVLDFSRMDQIARMDKRNLLAHVWRGVTWTQLKEACDKEGVVMPTPLAASSESVLTNIVGRNMVKQQSKCPEIQSYTMKVVLGDGRLHNSGPHSLKDEGSDLKDDGGPSLSHWYFGSDDVFGVICRASIFIYPKEDARETLCFSFSDKADLLKALKNVPRTEMGNEYLGANSRYLSWLLDNGKSDLPAWTAVVGFTGRARHVEYQMNKVAGFMAEFGGKPVSELKDVMDSRIDEVWYQASPAHTEFYSKFTRLGEFDEIIQPDAEVGQLIGSYDRGRCACAIYDFFGQDNGFGEKLEKMNLELAAKGAFFNRPQGKLADQIYSSAPNYKKQLRAVKSVVDPDFIINPGHIVSKDDESYEPLAPDESLGEMAGITITNVKKVREKLAEAVGSEWVSDNPADLNCYSRDFTTFSGERPNVVVLPQTVAEVQDIMRIAYSHKVPIVPLSTGFNHGGLTIPRKGGILIDMKRMDRLVDVDEESMVAVIEPGVRQRSMFRQVQKTKTYKDIPLKPVLSLSFGSVSTLSNYVSRGGPGSMVKYGNAPDLTSSMTWVLPNGEVLKVGPSAFSNVGELGLAWTSGPDINGMFFNADGAFGVCVDIAAKLWPEQIYEEFANAAAIGPTALPDACRAVYDLSQTNILEFIYKTHPGVMSQSLANELGIDPIDAVDMCPEEAIMIVVNGFDEEELEIKKEIVKEIVEREGLFIVDAGMLGTEEAAQADTGRTEGLKMALGVKNNVVGAYKGAFQWQAAWIKIDDIPEVMEKYENLVTKYWRTSDPTVNEKQAKLTGCDIQGPLPYARCGTCEFDYWWDQGNPEEVKRAAVMLRKSTNLLFDYGGIPIRNMFGFGELLIPRLGVYTEMLKDMRSTFDPENLMHPDVLPVTDDFV